MAPAGGHPASRANLRRRRLRHRAVGLQFVRSLCAAPPVRHHHSPKRSSFHDRGNRRWASPSQLTLGSSTTATPATATPATATAGPVPALTACIPFGKPALLDHGAEVGGGLGCRPAARRGLRRFRSGTRVPAAAGDVGGDRLFPPVWRCRPVTGVRWPGGRHCPDKVLEVPPSPTRHVQHTGRLRTAQLGYPLEDSSGLGLVVLANSIVDGVVEFLRPAEHPPLSSDQRRGRRLAAARALKRYAT